MTGRSITNRVCAGVEAVAGGHVPGNTARPVIIAMGLLLSVLTCRTAMSLERVFVRDGRGFVVVQDIGRLVVVKLPLSEGRLIETIFSGVPTIDAARNHAERALAGQIDLVASIGTLSDEQRAKLELAGQGDIHRFFTDVDSFLRTAPIRPVTQQHWETLWRNVLPFRNRYHAGLHGRWSLFRKTIPSVLTADQRAALQELEHDRAPGPSAKPQRRHRRRAENQ